jgi:hypothetical protein
MISSPSCTNLKISADSDKVVYIVACFPWTHPSIQVLFTDQGRKWSISPYKFVSVYYKGYEWRLFYLRVNCLPFRRRRKGFLLLFSLIREVSELLRSGKLTIRFADRRRFLQDCSMIKKSQSLIRRKIQCSDY